VRLEWDDGTGKRVSVEAHTRIVNPYGCMVVLKAVADLLSSAWPSPISPSKSRMRHHRLKGNSRPDGWEYGVELIAPEMIFGVWTS